MKFWTWNEDSSYAGAALARKRMRKDKAANFILEYSCLENRRCEDAIV